MIYKNALVGLVAFAAVAFGTTPTQVSDVSTSLHHASMQSQHKHVSTMFYSGSLRSNLKRLAADYGWHDMVWLPTHDYQWHGTVKVTGRSFDDVLTNVLKDYPLQAQFYDGNHILVVAERTL